jgi:hypothetical protein
LKIRIKILKKDIFIKKFPFQNHSYFSFLIKIRIKILKKDLFMKKFYISKSFFFFFFIENKNKKS